jgi:hypothetical protein
MTMVLPPLAETLSARQLAQHFNRLGNLPPRLLIAEGRIGSLVFYLTPRLRAELTVQKLQQLSASELPPPCPGDVIVVPERKIAKLQKYLLLDNVPYERAGRYRLYRVAKPQAAVGRGSDATANRDIARLL